MIAILFAVGVVALALAVGIVFMEPPSSSTPRSSTATSSIDERAQRTYEPLLLKALRTDEQCEVTKMFYQGRDRSGEIYWSAACNSGKSIMVRVNGDTGKSTYLDCGVASVVGVKCFEAFK